MKLLFFSDSHGYNEPMFDIIRREKPDSVIHLGDYVSDAREVMEYFPLLPVYSVRGNNDFEHDVRLHAAITPDNVPIYITHGHRDGVYYHSYGRVPQAAKAEDCRLAFFGHTHKMLLEWADDVLVCNPGSISMPRCGVPSYARLTIENGRALKLELLDVESSLLQSEKI